MNEHQMRLILDWFNNRVGTITCSVCSSSEFKFDSELTVLPVWRGGRHPQPDFTEGVAAVILTCTHCASIRMFSAAKMGILPAPTQRAPASDLPSHHGS